MTTAAPRRHHTYDEYLALDEASNVRLEYCAGDIYALAACLREIVLVAHDQRRIEVHRREADEWSHHQAGPGESIALDSIACRLDADGLYERACA